MNSQIDIVSRTESVQRSGNKPHNITVPCSVVVRKKTIEVSALWLSRTGVSISNLHVRDFKEYSFINEYHFYQNTISFSTYFLEDVYKIGMLVGRPDVGPQNLTYALSV